MCESRLSHIMVFKNRKLKSLQRLCQEKILKTPQLYNLIKWGSDILPRSSWDKYLELLYTTCGKLDVDNNNEITPVDTVINIDDNSNYLNNNDYYNSDYYNSDTDDDNLDDNLDDSNKENKTKKDKKILQKSFLFYSTKEEDYSKKIQNGNKKSGDK